MIRWRHGHHNHHLHHFVYLLESSGSRRTQQNCGHTYYAYWLVRITNIITRNKLKKEKKAEGVVAFLYSNVQVTDWREANKNCRLVLVIKPLIIKMKCLHPPARRDKWIFHSLCFLLFSLSLFPFFYCTVFTEMKRKKMMMIWKNYCKLLLFLRWIWRENK